MATTRLTVGQALVRFLAAQHTERDGSSHRLFAGCFGIFGHGNVAGLGQALAEAELTAAATAGSEPAAPGTLRYLQARNEQAMVHAAVGYARMRNRMSTLACTSSIGPGATNMVTGAALATINRLPVLLLPGDIFATRVASPVLQELEDPRGYDISVNDCFRPVSRFFDRVNRPEQLPGALLGAMRVLTDPAETGAVTLALPQDVQAEAYDWPVELVKLAAPDREVFVLVGDGSYLMMAQELVTAVAEGVKLIVVLVQNHGFASIGALSESVGAQRFGTRYRYRDPGTGRLDGAVLPVDLAANAESLGAEVLRARGVAELRTALAKARESSRTTVVHIETDPLVPGPDGGAWWDVPVAEVSSMDTTVAARETYRRHKLDQRGYLRP